MSRLEIAGYFLVYFIGIGGLVWGMAWLERRERVRRIKERTSVERFKREEAQETARLEHLGGCNEEWE